MGEILAGNIRVVVVAMDEVVIHFPNDDRYTASILSESGIVQATPYDNNKEFVDTYSVSTIDANPHEQLWHLVRRVINDLGGTTF